MSFYDPVDKAQNNSFFSFKPDERNVNKSEINEKNELEVVFEFLVGAEKRSLQHNEELTPAHNFNQSK